MDWFNIKLGVISASNAKKAVAGTKTDTRRNYMNELIGQVCTLLQKDIKAKQMEWGHTHEDAARATYELQSQKEIIEVPFVFRNDKWREGCSPDGLAKKEKEINGGVEIKCPYATENYIDFLLNDKIKIDHDWQVQFTMRVLECETYDYGMFDPRMKKKPIKYFECELDEKKQKTMADAIPQFIKDMDTQLAKIGIEFGDHWKMLPKVTYT